MRIETDLSDLAKRLNKGLKPITEEASVKVLSLAAASIPLVAHIHDQLKEAKNTIKNAPRKMVIIEPTKRVGWEKITTLNPQLNRKRLSRKNLKVL